jgi:hypothetical protein
MKRMYAIPLLVLMLALGSPIGGLAADYGSPSDASSNKAQNLANTIAVTGTVQKVDVDNNSVQIKDTSGKLQTVKVDVGTQISRQGSTIQLSELREGDIVTIKNANSTM